MEANNGYEYKVVRARLPWPKNRAAEKLAARARAQGWEIVNRFVVPGLAATPAVTIRRPVASDPPRRP
jgi:hypothetical protein